ncbi:MAG: WD40/YVTN/BNR-like repeat-containing protein, partial [Gemmatimonadota bacterium]
LWEDGGQRGIYRTTDGGESWELILEGANARTGAADLVMDPENPKKLYASLWQFRRWPHFFKSGGPGSGMFISTDGGESWREVTAGDGLPRGPLGRIGIAVSEGEPEVVYAIVEADTSEILRSDDGGRTWRTMNEGFDVHPRPFYYSELRVDPANENRLYRIAGSLTVSEDAGRSFELVVPSALIHGDVHS